MANIVYPNTFVANQPARASEVNANFDAITDQVNGNISEVNLATGAVTTVKLADEAVTAAKLASEAFTADKVAADAITTSKIEDGAVTLVKTTGLFGSNATAVYFGRVASDGSALSLPSGWSVTSPVTGLYTITHTLANLNTLIIATPNSASARFATSEALSSNTVRVSIRDADGNFVASAFYFMLAEYA